MVNFKQVNAGWDLWKLNVKVVTIMLIMLLMEKFLHVT